MAIRSISFKNVFVVLAVLVLALLFSSKAHAETSFILSPVKEVEKATGYYHEAVKPGDTKTYKFYLTNTKEQPLDIEIYPADAIPSQNGGRSFSEVSAKPLNVGSWFTEKGSKQVKLAPKEVKEFEYTLNVPDNISPGQYVGVIAAQEFISGKTESAGSDKASLSVDVVNRVGIQTVLEYQPENSTHKMTIDSLSHQYISGGNLQLTVKLTDAGTILERPTGKIIMTGSKGNEIYSSLYSADSIYANTTADMVFNLDKVLLPDTYKVYFEATYHKDSVNRTFEFNVSSDDSKKATDNAKDTGNIAKNTGGDINTGPVNDYSQSWILILIIIIFILVLLLLWFFLIFWRRRKKKKKEQEEKRVQRGIELEGLSNQDSRDNDNVQS